MNIKRIPRLAVCLLLVCCILINCSPIKAEATAAALIASPVFVPAAIAIGAVLMGLGILAVAGNPRFESVVSDCLDSLYEKGFLGDADEIEMYKMVGDDYGQYMISQELAEAVRDYLFEKEVVTESSVSEEYALYNGHLLPSLSNFDALTSSHRSPYSEYQVIVMYPDTGEYWMWSFEEECYLNDAGKLCLYSGAYFYSLFYTRSLLESCWIYGGLYNFKTSLQVHGTNSAGDVLEIIWSSYDLMDESGNLFMAGSDPVISGVSVSDGLTAGTIAGQDTTFADGYSTWASGAKSLPDLSDPEKTPIPYLPLGMGKTWEETITMTQAEVQAGTGTYEDTGTGTASDTVTASGLKGWLDTLRMTLVSGFSDLKEFLSSIWNGILSVVSSLASLPMAIGSFLRMIADNAKWLAAILAILDVLLEYISALFGWMPDPIPLIILTIFGIAIAYKILGREG